MNIRNTFNRLKPAGGWGMARALVVGMAMASSGLISAQNVNVTGAVSGNGTYATLGEAVAALAPVVDQTNANIVIDIVGNTTEGTATISIGAGTWTSMLIRPQGGAARTITAATTAGVAMITLDGADNVTIDGLNTAGNALTITNTTASATSGTSTIRLVGDATNNLIHRTTILGSANMAVGTNGGVIFFSTAASGGNGNDDNTISDCNIGPAGATLPTKGIFMNGTATSAVTNNSGNLFSNNNIYDFFGPAVSSAGVYISTGNTDNTIQGNRFYQTATRTQTTASQHSAIWIATTAGNNFQVTNNIIGFASPTQTGTYTFVGVGTGSVLVPVLMSVGTTTASNVLGNTIAGMAMSGAVSGTGSSASFRGIYVSGGLTTVNSNTIGSQSATGSITFTSSSTSIADVIGIYNFGSTNWVTNNNTIGGITASNSSTGAANIYALRCNTTSSVNWTCTNNTIGGTVLNSIQSTTTATGTIVNGIRNESPAGTFTGNTVRNLTAAGGTGTATSASVAGIVIGATSANHTLTANTIHTLVNSNASAATTVTGIQYGSSTGTNLVERNLIHSLSAASGSAILHGIQISGGTSTYRNNMISLGTTGASASTGMAINGINEVGGTNNHYHNSIFIGGVPTTGTANTFAVQSTITTTRNYINNIYFNNRRNAGSTGKHYAIRVAGTAANPTGLTSNFNILRAPETGGHVGLFNAIDRTLIGDWRTSTGQDAQSMDADPNFVAPAAGDLHINSPTPIESAGSLVASVTNDYDGQDRSTLSPVDIGADAGDFTPVDLSPPLITFSPLATTCTEGDRILTASITDATGVPQAGSGLPVLYWRINAGAYTAATGTYISGSDYSFSFGAGAMQGDVVQYYIVAQDDLGNVSASPSGGAGGFTANPPAAATPPTTPAGYTINAELGGTYTVGATGDFTTLSAAVAAYNTACLTSAVILSLTDATYPGETFPISIGQNAFASATNTLTIRPASGNTATISGTSASAIIVFNGADWVQIDGSNAPVTNSCCPLVQSTRDLTIQNTSTSVTSAVVWLQSIAGPNGATNNVVRNTNITGNSNTTTLYGIGMGGTSISTTSLGNGNNNNRIENNAVTRTQIGIYTQGASAANKNAGNVIALNLINASAPDNVQTGGIRVGFENGVEIACNKIANINAGATVYGIAAGAFPNNNYTSVSGNEVTGALIRNNVIDNIVRTGDGTAYGIVLAEVTTASPGTNVISNNMISGVRTTTGTPSDSPFGIRLGGGSTSATHVYYNTISLTGVGASSSPTFGIAINGSNPVVDLRNNIFSNLTTSSSATKVAIALAYNTYTNLTSNHNNFWAATSAVAAVNGFNTTPITLASWQSTTGKDADSKNVEPVFVSASDLHLDPTNASNISNLMTGGTPVSVVIDIDCEARTATPTIGADQFEVSGCAGAPNAGTSTASSATTFCANGTAGMTNNANDPLAGVIYQWQVGPVGGPYTDVTGGTGATTQSYTSGPLAAGTYAFRLRARCENETPPAGDSFSNEVVFTVNPIPTASPSSNSPICAGEDLEFTGGTDIGTTFSWTGPGFVSPNTAQNPVIAAAGTSASGTYTLITTANGCPSAPAVTTVTVDPTPSAVTITPSAPAPVCEGETIVLTAAGATYTVIQTFDFGTQASQNSASTTAPGYPAPFTAFYGGQRMQMLIQASELTAAGFTAGAVFNGLNFPVVSMGSNWGGSITALQNFQVKLGYTTATTISAFQTLPTTVRPAANFTPTVGYNNVLSFSTAPPAWNGTDNVIIETTFSNNITGATNDLVVQYNSPTGFQSTIVYRADGVTAAAAASATTVHHSYSARPDLRLTGSVIEQAPFIWSPSTGLNTSTGATVEATVTGDVTYTVTASTSQGCTATSASVDIIVDDTDTDGDGTPDCIDDCDEVPGQQGSFCDANPNPNHFGLGQLDEFCNCVSIPCTETVTMAVKTDANGGDTSWEITPDDSNLVICSGSGFNNNADVSSDCCLPEGCFKLRVFDSAGDGIAGGGYVLTMAEPNNARIIDNSKNFITGLQSSINEDASFCLPIGTDRTIFTSCDKLDWLDNQFIVASLNDQVSEVWINNAPYASQSANTGYEFWFFNPNGGYSHRVFKALNNASGIGTTFTRAAHLLINGSAFSPGNKIQHEVLMNVRVRSVVNGDTTAWGPACRFMISPINAACPKTRLIDDPNHVRYSCGAWRQWVTSQGVFAWPVSNASQYEFEFFGDGNYYYRTGSQYWTRLGFTKADGTSLALVGQWTVRVRARIGDNWCAWGDPCTVNIGTPGVLGGSQNMLASDDGTTTLNMWPNPNRGDLVNISLSEIPEGVMNVTVDMFDMFGRRVITRQLPVNDGLIHTVMDLQGAQAAGMYMVNVAVGEQVHTMRLVVQP